MNLALLGRWPRFADEPWIMGRRHQSPTTTELSELRSIIGFTIMSPVEPVVTLAIRMTRQGRCTKRVSPGLVYHGDFQNNKA
jgi:hypothetical protein